MTVSHRCAQRLVFHAILDPVKLTGLTITDIILITVNIVMIKEPRQKASWGGKTLLGFPLLKHHTPSLKEVREGTQLGQGPEGRS